MTGEPQLILGLVSNRYTIFSKQIEPCKHEDDVVSHAETNVYGIIIGAYAKYVVKK